VIDVKEAYEPLAIMRLKIKHDSRNKLKLIAGISQDTILNTPIHTIDFPIFNYQGGDFYMQGFNNDENAKEIEVSLDITPLLSYVLPGANAKYFIQIAEKDANNAATGEVLYFSVLDIQSAREFVSTEFPKEIENNNVTKLALYADVSYNQVEISTNELLGIIPGENSSCQITADGGAPPYHWEVLQTYSSSQVPLNYPNNQQTQLIFDEEPIYGVNIDLNFPFPYYNDTLYSLTAFVDGFIMFNDRPFPYPYFIGEESMLRNHKIIAPFMAKLVLDQISSDGVWVNSYSDSLEIIWKASCEGYEEGSELNFALKLFNNGTIEMHYGEMSYPENIMWSSGISNGDEINHISNSFFHQILDNSNLAFKYFPPPKMPDNTAIDQNGVLTMFLPEDSNIYEIDIFVRDDKSITSTKRFQLPSELNFQLNLVIFPKKPS
jgi:hypothetical protein